jgi:hypothetical protein
LFSYEGLLLQIALEAREKALEDKQNVKAMDLEGT